MLTAMPFTGHVTPLAAIATELVARGHDVRVYTGRAFAAPVARAGARLIPWRAAPDFDEHDLAATFPRLRSRRGLRQVLVNIGDLFLATGPGQVADLVAEYAREPWDVLVGEESSIGPALAAERLDIPWITVAILPLSRPSRLGPPSGLGLAPGRSPIGRARDAGLRRLVPALMAPLRAPLADARRAAGLEPSSARFDTAVFSPTGVLATGVPALDHERDDRPDSLRWVGRLAIPAPATRALPAWWPDLVGRRVVYVTQGTQNTDPDMLIRPALEALADHDVIVVVTTGHAGRTRLPFPVPPNARIADLLPPDTLLPLVDVVITNGGWGGVLAALAHGVPLVIGGSDLDKPEVAARVASSGAGVNLRTGRPRARAVRRAYARVAGDPAYRAAARRIGDELERRGGTRAAADLIEQTARGGSARQEG